MVALVCGQGEQTELAIDPALRVRLLEVCSPETPALSGLSSSVKALIVANEYLESEIGELMHAVSHA